jgi:4-amino-4-deoxy-L-arabinose transferase-like glycosyltransferase
MTDTDPNSSSAILLGYRVGRERRRLSRRSYRSILVAVALAAFILVLLATRWGIATSSDSARYIRSARHVLGREVRVEQEVSAEAKAEQAHYPPMYSSVLAVASLGGADPLNAARWLHALLLAANAVIAAELVRRFTESPTAALFTGVVSAFSHASVYIHTIALSEPLYVTLSLLSLGMLASHLRRPRWGMLFGAALICGAGVLTRYAGWALVPAGGVCLLLLSRRPIPRRLLDAMLFGVVACATAIGWSIRNQLMLGSATNRVMAWHPAGMLHLRDGARTAWNWLVAEAVVHPVLTGLAAIVAATILFMPLLLKRGDGDGGDDASDVARDRRTLSAVMIVFSLAFAALLIVSISLFDYHTPVDRRILSPVYAAWVIIAGCVMADVQRRPDSIRTAAWSVALLLAVWSIGRGARLAHEQFRDGSGFAHRHWRESQTLAALRANVPHEQPVYTNAPGAMYLLTHRPSIIALPSKFSASSMRANPKYGGQLRRMRDDVQSGRAVIVYLHRYARGRQRYNPTEQEVTELGFVPLVRVNDGAIYRAAPATAPSQERDAVGGEAVKQ